MLLLLLDYLMQHLSSPAFCSAVYGETQGAKLLLYYIRKLHFLIILEVLLIAYEVGFSFSH